MNPDVSVIIPVYNGEKYLAQAIESVVAQDYQPLDIIVVDDGSTDGSAAVAACFEEHIRTIFQPNRGPAAARNAGMKIAAGQFLAFLDADDLWPVGALAHQLATMLANPSADIVCGLVQMVTAVEGETYQNYRPPYFHANLGSMLIKNGVFEKIGLFDETLTYSEDWDWLFRACESNIAIITANHISLLYRLHSHSLTSGKDIRSLQFIRVLKKSLDRRRKDGGSAIDPIPGITQFIRGQTD